MIIVVGDILLNVMLLVMGLEGLILVELSDYIKGKKVVLFGLFGVFIGICIIVYVLSFICIKSDFDVKGVDYVICVLVNDLFVMKIWLEIIGVGEVGILFLGDVFVEFIKVIGMNFIVLFVGFYDCC